MVEALNDFALRPRDGPEPTRTVVIIDGHRTFAELLQFALDSTSDLSCVAVAYDVPSGLRLVAAHRPDLVVMDYESAGDEGAGVTATAEIMSRFPDTHVMLLTGDPDGDLMSRAAHAGARALMPKNGSLPDLLKAMVATDGDGLQVHPRLLGKLVRVTPPAVKNPLSRREQQVLAMLDVGLGTQEIANRLGISKNTCRGYVKSLLRKLDAHSQLEAVAVARRRGLVPLSDAR